MATHVLTVKDLTKIFETDQGRVLAVDNISFRLSGDELFTMLGPSGCGKTTTLRMVAGLEEGSVAAIAFTQPDSQLFHRGDT